MCLKGCRGVLCGGHSHHPDPTLLSGMLLYAHHTQLQLPGGQKERAVWGLSPTGAVLALVTKAGSVFAALTASVSTVLRGLISVKAHLLSQPLPLQWALPRSIVLGLCFSLVFSLVLRAAWA
ncbi:unnamed protein product [Rangifer tarandus platyrhynchus]|uniref:Uncharacterized protein n=2 Tax=Rangifer tarandus platyrhynchus TaxID=3082113 RepID=A0ABN8ZEG0_RANTA|nr:unnamed protein product [Rangifer tarandus platyrhynchus]